MFSTKNTYGWCFALVRGFFFQGLKLPLLLRRGISSYRNLSIEGYGVTCSPGGECSGYYRTGDSVARSSSSGKVLTCRVARSNVSFCFRIMCLRDTRTVVLPPTEGWVSSFIIHHPPQTQPSSGSVKKTETCNRFTLSVRVSH